MGPDTWVTSLLRLQIRVYSQHYVELIILGIFLIYYRNLRKNKLGIILPLWIGVLIMDVVFRNFSFFSDISILQILPFFVFTVGLYSYPSLKKFRISIILLIIFIDLFIDAVTDYYANRGMYNVFLINLFYAIATPLFYILFYNMLQPKEKYKKIYIIVAMLSVAFFLYEYFSNSEVRLNYKTIITFRLQSLIFSCLIIAKLAVDENSKIKLVNEPYFWICAGLILFALIAIVFDGLHPYLVENYIEVYIKYRWLSYLIPLTTCVVDFCYLYAFILCGKRYQDRLTVHYKLFNRRVHR